MPYLELLDNNLSKLLIADIVGGERGPLKTAYGLGLIISSRKNLILKKNILTINPLFSLRE